MIAYWIVAGFFTAIGFYYGNKLVESIDKPEVKIEQKIEDKGQK